MIRRRLFLVVYILLWTIFLLQFVLIFLAAIAMAPITLEGARWIIPLFKLINAATILSIPLAPIIFAHKPGIKQGALAVVIASLLLFVFPAYVGETRSKLSESARLLDRRAEYFTWPERVAYYSSHAGNQCAELCVGLLYNGLVKEFAAYPLQKVGINRNHKTDKKGLIYTIETGAKCEDPKKITSPRSAYIPRLTAALGYCLISREAGNGLEPLQIIYTEHDLRFSGNESNSPQVRQLSILKVGARSAPNLQLDRSEIIARKTVTKYQVLDVPFLGTNIRYVDHGGARLLGSPRKPVDAAQTDIELLAAIVAPPQTDRCDQSQRQIAKCFNPASPTNFEIIIPAMSLLRNADSGVSLTSLEIQLLDAAKKIVIDQTHARARTRGKRYKSDEMDAGDQFTMLALEVATQEISKRQEQPITSNFDNQIIMMALRTTYEGLGKLEYRDNFSHRDEVVSNFEKALFRYAVYVSAHSVQQSQPSKSTIELVRYATLVASMRQDIDPVYLDAIAFLLKEAPLKNETEIFMRRHGYRYKN